MKQQIDSGQQLAQADMVSNPSRRGFLQLAGGLAGAGLLLAACKKVHSTSGINLGSGDTGLLNYAFALEQLEAAFYIQVLASPYTNITSAEQALLTDIRDHEIAHREFFRNVLGDKAIPDLVIDFSSVNFSDRVSVLTTAKKLEDLGIAAYNGAGNLFQSPDYLLFAGKIVSVEARHAAYVRDLLDPGSFGDTSAVDGNGLDGASRPADILSIANGYFTSKLDASNLPTS